jgi:hypothetical protein
MRATEFIVEGLAEGSLNEYRDQLWTWVQSKFPRTQWPEYVQRDFLYQQAKGIRNQAELDDFLKRNRNDFGKVQWRLEKLPITMDIFTPKTQRMILSREGGSSNPFQVPRDAERHAQQLKIIQQKGVSEEPIIVAKLSNGYDLIEGWHRTIQHFAQYPNGYTGPAYVAVAQGQQGMAEASDNMLSEEQPEVRPHRVTDKELVELLGKGKTNAMLRHPWFQRYSSYEKAYRYARDRWGFVTVDMFPYMTSVNKTADGSIRPTIYVSFIFSYTCFLSHKSN